MTAERARRRAPEPGDRNLDKDLEEAKARLRSLGILIEGRFDHPPLPPQPSPYSDHDAAVAELADWLGAHA